MRSRPNPRPGVPNVPPNVPDESKAPDRRGNFFVYAHPFGCRIDLRGTQTVVAQYGSGGIRVDQYPHDGNPFFALLNGEAPKVLIQFGNPAGEGLVGLGVWIEKLLFKHASSLSRDVHGVLQSCIGRECPTECRRECLKILC